MEKTARQERKTRRALGTALTILGGLLWGFSGACGEYMFEKKGVTARWLVPIRMTTAGLLMVLFFAARGRGGAFRIWKKRRDALDMLCYGLIGLMLCQYTYFQAIEYSNAGTATVLQYISPALILLVVCLQERRRPAAVETLALAGAVLGVFLIATHGNPRSMVLSRGALSMGLISAVAVVFYNIQPQRLLQHYPAPYLLGWGMLVGGVVLMPLFRPWNYQVAVDGALLAALCGVLFLGTIAAFSFYMQGVKLLGPARASLYACAEPIAAALFSSLWLGANFAPMDFVGFACILAAILTLGIHDLRKTHENT